VDSSPETLANDTAESVQTRQARRRRLLRRAAGLAIVTAAFVVVLPQLADYGDVWGEVKRLDASSLLLFACVTLLNLATFAPPWMLALPGLGVRRAFVVTQASTASTYVAPGGAAVGIATSFLMLRGWGFGRAAIGTAVALTSTWNQLALLAFPALAFGLLTVTGGHDPLLQTFGVVGLGVFVAVVTVFAFALASEGVARRTGALARRCAGVAARVLRRGDAGWTAESVVGFRNRTIQLLRRRGLALTLATVAGQLTVFIVLLASLRELGVPAVQVSATEAFAAWSIIRLIGSLPLTPGGIGIVEVGLTTSLIGFGGEETAVVAAVLVYRSLTVIPTLALGLLAGATWRSQAPRRGRA
jgi:uncharacterized membrane protein YbhN (UPF0104 family)